MRSQQDITVHLRPWRDDADDDEFPKRALKTRRYMYLKYGEYYSCDLETDWYDPQPGNTHFWVF